MNKTICKTCKAIIDKQKEIDRKEIKEINRKLNIILDFVNSYVSRTT